MVPLVAQDLAVDPSELPKDLPIEVKEIVNKFQNITHEKFANQLSPMNTIQHTMDLILRPQLSILPLVKFAHYLVNWCISHGLFEVVYGSKVHQPIELSTENFIEHARDIHANVRKKIALSNGAYKIQVDTPSDEYNVGDYIFVHIHPRGFPIKYFKKFHAHSSSSFQIVRKIGTNAYVINLFINLNNNHILNIEDFLSILGHPILPLIYLFTYRLCDYWLLCSQQWQSCLIKLSMHYGLLNGDISKWKYS